MPHTWSRVLSASTPATFGDIGPANRRLELQYCFLLPRADGVASESSRGPTLYCSVGGERVRYALAKPTEASPSRELQVRLFARGGTSLSITGAGKVLVVGVVRKEKHKKSTRTLAVGDKSSTDSAASAMLEAQAKIDRLKKEIAAMKVREFPADRKSLAKKQSSLGSSSDSCTRHSDIAQSSTGLSESKRTRLDFGFAKPQALKHATEEGETQVLPNGLCIQVIGPGKRQGQVACDGDVVQVKYEGRLARSGKRFDKGTIRFRLGKGKVIRGWDEGIRGMGVRENRKLFVPAALGYGSKGAPPDIPCNADLDFDVQLLKIL